ncbi:MAG: hypothetical protein HGA38_01710 [Candidatus Moranbacteria bacterium]|nr:hypothetical protein [Candidatus Moranbacteria bacterium]NTW45475.1 hypothetical protein [Candidatus Moranbacteria bacterium]
MIIGLTIVTIWTVILLTVSGQMGHVTEIIAGLPGQAIRFTFGDWFR